VANGLIYLWQLWRTQKYCWTLLLYTFWPIGRGWLILEHLLAPSDRNDQKTKNWRHNPMFTVSCHPHLQKFILNKTKTRFFDIVTFEILKSFNLLPLTNRWTLLSSIFVSANLLICNCKITLKGLISSQNVSFYQYLWHKKVGRIYHEKRGLPVFVFLPQSVTFYLNGPLNLAWLCLDVWEHFDRS